MIISFSECVILFTVFITECVAIVTVNLLSIILFIKNKSLRTRSMYLVMNLTVVYLLVGSLAGSVDSFYSQNRFCPLVKKLFFILGSYVCISCSYPSLSFCLPDKHCCDFFRAISRYGSSIHASAHEEMGLFDSNCCCLGFIYYYISHCGGDRMVSDDTPPALLVGIILSFVFNCYLCFLLVHSV